MNKTTFKILTFASMLLAVFGMFNTAGAATLTLSSPSGSYKVGQNFSVNVNVNSTGESFDTVRAKLNYSSQNLEVVRFSLNSSYSFPSGSNGYDNNSGTFSYGAGIPGGANEGNTFGTIVFKVKAPGEAKINFGSGSLVLSSGENKLSGEGSPVSLSLTEADNKPPSQPKPKTEQKSADKNKEEVKPTENNPDEAVAETASTSPFQPEGISSRDNAAAAGIVIMDSSKQAGAVAGIGGRKIILYSAVLAMILAAAWFSYYFFYAREKKPKFPLMGIDDF